MGLKRTLTKKTGENLIFLSSAFDEFMTEKEVFNLSQATLRNYAQSFEFFCRYNDFDEETTTEEVKLHCIYKWINTMRLEGKSPSSINHYLRDVRTFLNWCMDADRAYISPAFKVEQVEKQEEPLKMFTQEEIDAILEKPRKNAGFVEWRCWAMANWVLATGNRASTLIELRIGDINFSKKEIVLRHTKNKKAQVIPLSSSLETVIKEYLRVWRKDASPDAFLFSNIGEEQLTTNALRHSFSRYCQDRGATHTNIHGLRHNFAKMWVQNNGNMFVLQRMLGHSTLDMTRHYVNLFSEDLKDDFDKFNPLDNLKKKAKRTQTIKKSLYKQKRAPA